MIPFRDRQNLKFTDYVMYIVLKNMIFATVLFTI